MLTGGHYFSTRRETSWLASVPASTVIASTLCGWVSSPLVAVSSSADLSLTQRWYDKWAGGRERHGSTVTNRSYVRLLPWGRNFLLNWSAPSYSFPSSSPSSSFFVCRFIPHWDIGPQPTQTKPVYLFLPLLVPSKTFTSSQSLSLFLVCVISTYIYVVLRFSVEDFSTSCYAIGRFS